MRGSPPEALAIRHVDQPGWRIPKGMQEGAETLEECALREVFEETGQLAAVRAALTAATWSYAYGGSTWDETCHFYLLTPATEQVDAHDEEAETIQWIPLEQLADSLHYEAEQEVARLAAETVHTYAPLALNRSHPSSLHLLGRGRPSGCVLTAGRLAISGKAVEQLLMADEPMILARKRFGQRDVSLLVRSSGMLAADITVPADLADLAHELGRALIAGVRGLVVRRSVIELGQMVIPEYAWITLNEMTGDVRFGRVDLA